MHVYGSCSMHEIIFLRRGGVLVVQVETRLSATIGLLVTSTLYTRTFASVRGA